MFLESVWPLKYSVISNDYEALSEFTIISAIITSLLYFSVFFKELQ